MTELIERTVPASPSRVWELWTTAEGISRWWSPDGFRTDVTHLDLQPGGDLVYTMTAVAPATVAFMQENGMPLATQSRKRFTEVCEPTRIAYASIIDFVPEHAPYEHVTEVDLTAVEGGTHIKMRVEPLHDDVWTQRLLAGRTNELANLDALLRSEQG